MHHFSPTRWAAGLPDAEQLLSTKGAELPEPVTTTPSSPSSKFVLPNELIRGVLAGTEEIVHYMLMLVVMYVVHTVFPPLDIYSHSCISL